MLLSLTDQEVRWAVYVPYGNWRSAVKLTQNAQVADLWTIPSDFMDQDRQTIDLIGSAPESMTEAQPEVPAGALSIRPFQVSRWRLRRTRQLWVLNAVLVLRNGLERAFLQIRSTRAGTDGWFRVGIGSAVTVIFLGPGECRHTSTVSDKPM
jgi:hypothetical protein